MGRGGQSRHTTPSERTNARARPSRVSSAPFSEQRPRFGSTERARSLTKTPARRQISDPRFPVGGEKKTSGNLARGSYASTPRRVTAGTAERGTMAEPNPAETGEVKTLWVGDLVSAPSRRASSCPARQPPIFWFQPGFLAKRRVLSNSDAASDARGRSLRRRAGNTGSGNFEIFSTFSPGFASRNER